MARLGRLLGLVAQIDRPEPLDLLFGLRAIARFMGLTKKQARSVIGRRGIPCFTLAGVVCARRGSIERHLALLERAAGGE